MNKLQHEANASILLFYQGPYGNGLHRLGVILLFYQGEYGIGLHRLGVILSGVALPTTLRGAEPLASLSTLRGVHASERSERWYDRA